MGEHFPVGKTTVCDGSKQPGRNAPCRPPWHQAHWEGAKKEKKKPQFPSAPVHPGAWGCPYPALAWWLTAEAAVAPDPPRATCCFNLHQDVFWGPWLRSYIPSVWIPALTVPAAKEDWRVSIGGGCPSNTHEMGHLAPVGHRRAQRAVRLHGGLDGEQPDRRRSYRQKNSPFGAVLNFLFLTLCTSFSCC